MSANAARKIEEKNTELTIAVEERHDQPGVWTVEAIDMAGDGSIFQAFFAGPQARERAEEYAHFKYGRR